MNNQYEIGVSRPLPLCRWWLRTRPCTSGIQLDPDMLPCMEFYVPWWAWPFELLHRVIFGYPKLQKIDPSDNVPILLTREYIINKELIEQYTGKLEKL